MDEARTFFLVVFGLNFLGRVRRGKGDLRLGVKACLVGWTRWIHFELVMRGAGRKRRGGDGELIRCLRT